MNKRGFTLIELVAAILISGIACTLAFQQLQQAWKRKVDLEIDDGLVANKVLIEAIIRTNLDKDCAEIASLVKQKVNGVSKVTMNCTEGNTLIVSWTVKMNRSNRTVLLRGSSVRYF